MVMARFGAGHGAQGWHDVTAAASDAQDARMARFSARDNVVSAAHPGDDRKPNGMQNDVQVVHIIIEAAV